ncbi:MAG: sigma-70 region 4 domain-containing protein [Protaetiibacter sp.]
MANETAGIDKVANLLALLLIKDTNKSAGAATLAASGFTNKEIAGLLGTTEGSVRAFISQAKKKAEKPDKSNDG